MITERQNWLIKYPQEIVVDDIIVYQQARYQVLRISKGCGAGSMEFGEYWSLKATPVSPEYLKYYSKEETTFWLYDNEPVPTLRSERSEHESKRT